MRHVPTELLSKSVVVAESEAGVYVAPLVRRTEGLGPLKLVTEQPDMKRIEFKRHDRE
jgi:hypothetical protein